MLESWKRNVYAKKDFQEMDYLARVKKLSW